MVRPYPKLDRKTTQKPKKGKLLGKSRIYTDTPEKIRLEELEKTKEIKKKEKESRGLRR